MQTFLPYESFARSAACLDRQRLGKQRVETLQIMGALINHKGWINHPATKMWRGYERALLEYQRAICTEWTDNRGYKDTCWDKTWDVYHAAPRAWRARLVMPTWLGREDVHLSHQANLLRKDPEHYSPHFPGVAPAEGYVWPV